MPRLHLIYDGKYINEQCGLKISNNNNNNNGYIKSQLTFGDDAFNGRVNFNYDETNGILTMDRLNLKWNTHLMNYYKNQVVQVKCTLYQRYSTIIPIKTISFHGNLNKNTNIISWKAKQFPLTKLYSNICWQVSLAIPAATKDYEYVPTVEEIRQEIAKLSPEEIEKERKEFNEYLKSGDPWIICESLEEKIGTYLMQKKKEQTKEKILIKKFTNEISNDFSDFV